MASERKPAPAAGVQLFRRSPAQIAALREVCRLWHGGPESFWAFDDVLLAVSRPSSLAFFVATDEDAPWHAAVLVDVGPFTADLLYVYVRQEWRRHGLARILLEHLFGELRSRPQIEALFLEVRASNIGAQKLYQALNMQAVGTRRSYYANGEDALVFKMGFRGDDATEGDGN